MLRIIAGELRGRRIRVPRVDGLRPTGERVREALFSILAERTVGARVLDAYAGSGALGFEALSRGAASAVFVEANAVAVREIEKSAAALGVGERCRVVRGRALDALGRGPARGPFDLILADPPWSAGEGPSVLERVAERGLLAAGGLLVLESPSRASGAVAPEPLEHVRNARYGDTALDFYRGIDPES